MSPCANKAAGRWHPARLAAGLLRYLLYLAAATAALHVFMSKESLFEAHRFPEYSFEHMIDSSAGRPFVYRRLMPELVNASLAAMPASLRERYAPTAGTLIQAYGRKVPPGYWTQTRSLQYLITFGWMTLFAFASLVALRAMVRAALPDLPAFVAEAAPLGFGLALPLAFMNGGFMYDFAELFFLFACTALVFARRPWTLLVLFLLAVFNKESNLLIAPFAAAIVAGRDGIRAGLRQGLVLGIPGTAMLATVWWWYAGAPGSVVYHHLAENLAFWSQPGSWLGAMTFFTPLVPFPRGLNLVLVSAIGLLISYRWRERDLSLRALIMVSAAANLPLLLLFSWRDETRNLFLMAPALVLGLTDALWRLSSSAPGLAAGKARDHGG